jgi:4-hydroxythreonine-4-phosphate dehydrogenase
MHKPLLGITLGDPAGTGPELISKALTNPEIYRYCRPLVIGSPDILEAACRTTGATCRIRAINDPAAATPSENCIDILATGTLTREAIELGKVSAECGRAAYEYITAATALALEGQIDAIVTSAINKEALNLAGHHFDGHTGLLAELCGAPGATMMLAAGNLRVSHVSTHLSLREAINRVQPERILRVIELTRDAVRQFGFDDPRIAVAGLNPHAGEGGLFGNEDQTHIFPAVEAARSRGWKVSGPYPGDTVFFRTLQGEFDAAIAMYHDQGHVAVKMLGIWLGVNITLGLPIVRTSVEHGTNFDMAGTGRSDPRSLLEAIRCAAQLATTKPPSKS